MVRIYFSPELLRPFPSSSPSFLVLFCFLFLFFSFSSHPSIIHISFPFPSQFHHPHPSFLLSVMMIICIIPMDRWMCLSIPSFFVRWLRPSSRHLISNPSERKKQRFHSLLCFFFLPFHDHSFLSFPFRARRILIPKRSSHSRASSPSRVPSVDTRDTRRSALPTVSTLRSHPGNGVGKM